MLLSQQFKDMGIDAKFDFEALKKEAYEWLNNVLEAVKEAFMLASLDTVNQSKANNTYQDQTGNLRSSIGYVLYYNGQEVSRKFEGTPHGTQAGAKLARTKAEELGDKGFVAVIVAGEHYARYVEAKGFDVLTGSTFRFADNIKRRLADVNYAFGTKF